MTYGKFNAVNKLANYLGKPLNVSDVHYVEPLNDDGKNSLNVYGVETNGNDGSRTFTFYTADYGRDRFKSVTTREKHFHIRQKGDATLVGSIVIGW